MNELKLDATVANIEEVTEWVNEQLNEAGCSVRARIQIDVAIDEIFSNIAKYAYPEGNGKASVKLEITENPLTAVITFTDSGLPFNPLKTKIPHIGRKAEEREIGGLGIFMVKKSMDDVSYERSGNFNILKITKKL